MTPKAAPRVVSDIVTEPTGVVVLFCLAITHSEELPGEDVAVVVLVCPLPAV